MRTSIYAAVLLVTLSLAGSACSDSDTPTQTFTVLDSFSGTWSGSVASGPAGVDWDPMELLLVQSGRRVGGTIVNSSGETWLVEGEVSLQPTTVVVEVDGFAIPAGACYAVSLWFNAFERGGRGQIVAMSGLITGRCFGTLMTPIRLERAGV